MTDSIRAFFEAAEFENVDEMLFRFTPENAKRVGQAVAERTKAIVAERDRLRKLVAKAYSEGFDHGVWAADDADDEYTPSSDDWWPESDARKALQEADG